MLGPAGAGPGLVTQGLFPPSGPRGQRRPRPQGGPGKEVVRSSPQSGHPSSPAAPRSRGGRGLPRASPELQPQATSVHTSLGQGSWEDRRNQAESRLHGVGEDTPQPPLIHVWERQRGSVHKDAATQGPSSHLL